MRRTATLAIASVYAATYVALIAVFPFLSFSQVNVRIANVLKGMVKFWVAGVLLGNFLAVVIGNYLFSPIGLLDVVLSPPISTCLLAVAYLIGKKSFLAGLAVNAAGLGVYLSWLISYTAPAVAGLTFVGLLPLLLVGVAISDVVLPYSLYQALKRSEVSKRAFGGAGS